MIATPQAIAVNARAAAARLRALNRGVVSRDAFACNVGGAAALEALADEIDPPADGLVIAIESAPGWAGGAAVEVVAT